MVFTEEQQNHVRKQLQAHKREDILGTILVDKKRNISLELLIDSGVFASDIMSSGIYLAQFLYQHQDLYMGKDVLDMGCGSGIQGLVMSKYGAKSVGFSDINPKAIANTKKNIERHSLVDTVVYVSDLFATLPQHKFYDVIVFNHPFFSGKAETFKGDVNDNQMLRKSMLGGNDIIKKFFHEVSKYLHEKGIIIMPYFHFAGVENDPATHASKYKLKISQIYKIDSEQGLQLGDFSIYVISKE